MGPRGSDTILLQGCQCHCPLREGAHDESNPGGKLPPWRLCRKVPAEDDFLGAFEHRFRVLQCLKRKRVKIGYFGSTSSWAHSRRLSCIGL